MEYTKEWQKAHNNKTASFKPDDIVEKTYFKVLLKGTFEKNEIIILIRNDGSQAPKFTSLINPNKTTYCSWYKIKPISNSTALEALKQGTNNNGETIVLNLTNLEYSLLYNLINYNFNLKDNFKLKDKILKFVPTANKHTYAAGMSELFKQIEHRTI